MNVAALSALYSRTGRECLAELISALDGLAAAATTADRLAADEDRAVLERLERIAEGLDGCRRLANQARAALTNELRPSELGAA